MLGWTTEFGSSSGAIVSIAVDCWRLASCSTVIGEDLSVWATGESMALGIWGLWESGVREDLLVRYLRGTLD